VRDYIHVCDIAHAHTLALNYLLQNKNETNCDVFNLGTGDGLTVLEIINEFEKTSGVKLNYEIGPRRPGDVIAIYANNDKAKKMLGWNPVFNLQDMMSTAWKWELKIKADEKNI
jgi:UDP-glucose 4-epimerase